MKKETKKKKISEQFKNLIAEYKEGLKEVLDGSSFAKTIAKSDKEKFEQFKKGSLVSDKVYDYKNMYILSLLEGLGFPMDEVGTYLYKEVILEVGELLTILDEDSSVKLYNLLYDSLNDIDSRIYSWIHSDYLEIGKKSFMFYLNESFDKIDNTKVNKDIHEALFGDEIQPDYAFQTVQLGMQTLVFDNYML